MSSSNAKVKNVSVAREALRVELDDGRIISAPLTWYPSLVVASARQLSNWKPCAAGSGIYWPDIDYHLSVDGILRGAREAEGVTRQLMTHA